MATNTVDIEQVPPDIDPMEVGVVLNPFTEDFVHPYASKPQTIPAGVAETKFRFVEKDVPVMKDGKETGETEKKKVREEYIKVKPGRKQFPLYVAVHMAKHIAQRIIREDHIKMLSKIENETVKMQEEKKPIPDFKGKVWAKMKELVETDSHFFDEGTEQETRFTT